MSRAPAWGVGGWVADRCGLDVRDAVPAGRVPVSELLRLALRHNPRRAHLLVSVVLGKHLPVDPRLARAAGLTLGLLAAEAVGGAAVEAGAAGGAGGAVGAAAVVRALRRALAGAPDGSRRARDRAVEAVAGVDPAVRGRAAWVLGFGETATGLGQAVAEVLGAPAVHSTRRPGTLPVAATFTEAHSHAQAHSLAVPAGLLRRPGVGVLVDDELSTGATALNAIRALHEVCPRRRYVLAVLVDVRSAAAVAELAAGVRALGSELTVVSLSRGSVTLPPDLPDVARRALAAVEASCEPGRGPRGECPAGRPAAPVTRLVAPWPDRLPDGARAGLPASQLPGLVEAAAAAGALVLDTLAAEGPAGSRGQPGEGAVTGPILVLGTEEHLDVPLRVAEALADALAARDAAGAGAAGTRAAGAGAAATGGSVLFSSTTRSPVAAVDDPAYPIRTVLPFGSHDEPADGPGPRFAYNVLPGAGEPWWSAVVLVVDRDAATPALHAPGGLVEGLRQAAGRVLVLTTGPASPVVSAQDPLRGPQFGSYAPDDVGWLLTDLSQATLEAPAADREELIQSGRAHYAESLPVEYEPSPEYQRLYDEALASGARRVALAVGLLAGLLRDRHGRISALVSLARAGTPVGVLLRRWFAREDVDVPHLTVSIVRGRGIDQTALEWIAARHDPARCAFVDGWTGKGAIARELAAALATAALDGGPAFDPEIAVLADPGACTSLYGTREDWLIPSSCLNSTVSGLVSRTVLNPELTGRGDHHGAKFYAGLAAADRSRAFIDAVTAQFDGVAGAVARELPGLLRAERTPTWAGWAAVAAVAGRFGIDNLNLVKPGVGETTRVLLRRVPWQILVRERGIPDLAHIERLAAERDVPVAVEPDLPFACIGLIRPAVAGAAGG